VGRGREGKKKGKTRRKGGDERLTRKFLSTVIAPAASTAPASYEETSLVLKVTPEALTMRSAGTEEKEGAKSRISSRSTERSSPTRLRSRRKQSRESQTEELTSNDTPILQHNVPLPRPSHLPIHPLIQNNLHPLRLELLLQLFRQLERVLVAEQSVRGLNESDVLLRVLSDDLCERGGRKKEGGEAKRSQLPSNSRLSRSTSSES